MNVIDDIAYDSNEVVNQEEEIFQEEEGFQEGEEVFK